MGRKYLPSFICIAKALIAGGAIKGNYTPRQLADYWLNQAVGF